MTNDHDARIFRRKARAQNVLPISIQIHTVRAARAIRAAKDFKIRLGDLLLDSLSLLDLAHAEMRDGTEYRVHVCARIRDAAPRDRDVPHFSRTHADREMMIHIRFVARVRAP